MKTNSNLVSIILPTYNGSKYIKQSIDSCLTQTYHNIELIVVDDCSTDATPDIVKSYADPRLRYIRHDENKKLPLALNTGFASSAGQYLTWTSDDNYFAPTAIEELVKFIEANPREDLIYADFYEISENNEKVLIEADPISDILKHNCVGPCFLYRRKIYDSLGGYRKDMFLCEDYEYWLRIYVNHYRMTKYNKPLYYYRCQPNSLTTQTKPITILSLEIKLLKDVFSNKSFIFPLFSYSTAISYRYFCAAWAFLRAGEKKEAFRYIVKSILSNPLFFFMDKERIGLAVRIFFGERVFKAVRACL